MKEYEYNHSTRCWHRVGFEGINYSDGEATEQRYWDILRKCSDVSAFSVELRAHITDWPSEYHFSPVRHNLLRPFTFAATDRVLELGCGWGAMTRYLGETGAVVAAVEGSPRRAAIAGERCRDLSNVKVYCDNLTEFKTEERFDVVTLIGVLEYAPLFIESDDPVQICLERALSFLKDDGVLILAIENKLGLKYFAGCHEDHLGIRYFGINDLYTSNTPVTFGKIEIAGRLRRSGFGHIHFFYPFPDYKLADLILSDVGSEHERLNVADMLVRHVGRDYQENYYRAFAEDLAWRVVADNRLVGDMANSFLIRAGRTLPAASQVDWLAKIYSRTQRKAEFLMESTIGTESDGLLMVRKQRMIPAHTPKNSIRGPFRHVPEDSVYIYGRLLLGHIRRAVVRGESLVGIASQFAPWLTFLLAHAMPGKGGKLVLPGNFVDCVPANLIVNEQGNLEFFDAEWVCETEIPIAWVLIRGIAYSVTGCLSSRTLVGMTHRQFIDAILSQLNHSLDDGDYALADSMERKFSTYCHLPVEQAPPLREIMNSRLYLFTSLSEIPDRLTQIRSTVLWHLTRPLRAVWNFCRMLRGRR
jgi:SAM-dependent methyltransferase